MASGEALNRVVAAYARPTRIVRGKEVDASWKVNEALFAVPEESALWDAYKQTASALHPGSTPTRFPLSDFNPSIGCQLTLSLCALQGWM